ncbi:MAG: GNAT family N-acetyltransferase [Ilumatobacteraceae bacterium]
MTDNVHPLDNPVWTALTTTLSDFAIGHGAARTFRREVAVFAAIDDTSAESWDELASLAGSSQLMMCGSNGVHPPPDWTYLGGGLGHQMVLGSLVDAAVPAGIRPLGDDDVEAMVALVALTEPGPFRPRTIELGGYHGVFENGRLIAMAGQRMRTPTHTEISAVCTHPDARRRGLAAAVTAAVARGIVADGSTPILHVAESNDGARRVYQSLGFRTRSMITFAAVRPPVTSVT